MKIVKITLLIGMLSLLFSVLSVSAETAASVPDPEKAAVVASAEKVDAGKATPTQNETISSTEIKKVGDVLFVILVLSVVFEVAMTPVFNWRYFLVHAEGKGWKTPIVTGAALLVFWSYDLDIIHDLLVALGMESYGITFGGQLLTALLIAGGSDGIFRIFTELKIRNPVERKEKAEQARAALAKAEKEAEEKRKAELASAAAAQENAS